MKITVRLSDVNIKVGRSGFNEQYSCKMQYWLGERVFLDEDIPVSHHGIASGEAIVAAIDGIQSQVDDTLNEIAAKMTEQQESVTK